MIVWLLETAYDYEGSDALGVYADEQLAMEAARRDMERCGHDRVEFEELDRPERIFRADGLYASWIVSLYVVQNKDNTL